MIQKTIRELATRVAANPDLERAMRDNPVQALTGLAATPLDQDVWIYRLVVGALGLVLLICAVGGIILANTTAGPPDLLLSLGSAAVGALAGLIAPRAAS